MHHLWYKFVKQKPIGAEMTSESKKSEKTEAWSKVVEWTQSENGREAITQAREKAAESIASFKKSIMVDSETMNSSFNV